VLAGCCPVQSTLRAFRLTTNRQNESSMDEVLLDDPDYLFIGSGAAYADQRVADLGRVPTNRDLVDIIQAAIDDPAVKGVGG